MNTVTLHIERLVLEGLPVGSHDGPLVQAAIEAELARLIGEGGGGLAKIGSAPLKKGLAIDAVSSRPDTLGVQIAQSIYGSISR
jgi:hypothetical protein